MLRRASLIALLAIGVGAIASPAGAAGPLRSTDYTVTGSLRASAFTLDDLHLTEPAAGVATDDTLVLPRDRLEFVPHENVLVTAPGRPFDGVPMTVDFEPLGDLRATIDLATGAVSGTLQAQLVFTAAGFFDGCPIGPVELNLDSAKPGGSAYDATTGEVTVVDDGFALPAVAPGGPECARLEGDLNAAFGLLSGSATAEISLTITTDPILTPTDPTVTIPTSTTTATTTTTTVAPSPPSSSQAASTTAPPAPAVDASQTTQGQSPAPTRAKPRSTNRAPAPSTSDAETTTSLQVVAVVAPGTTQTPPAVPQVAAAVPGPRVIEPIAEASPDATPRRVGILLGSAVLVALCLALMRSEVHESGWARRRRRRRHVRFR